jgi:menaquinone-dependent protoporphyrinogen oxidase
MARSIVVGYGTKRGSTREVAEAIAAVLRERGFAVELLPAQKVDGVGRYDGVVLGGALYAGRLQRDARRFLKRRRKELATLPVAVFALGLARTRRSTCSARGSSSSVRLRRCRRSSPC